MMRNRDSGPGTRDPDAGLRAITSSGATDVAISAKQGTLGLPPRECLPACCVPFPVGAHKRRPTSLQGCGLLASPRVPGPGSRVPAFYP
jgi:hypothetical protein